MPYVFAHHFSGRGTAEALELYRSQFRPSPELAEPRTFLTVNAAVAQTREEAERLALPAAARDGRAAHRRPADPAARWSRRRRRSSSPEAAPGPAVDAMRAALGDRRPGRRARARIDELAATYDVDEVMVHPVGRRLRRAPTGGPAPPARQTLRLLAG